MGKHLNKLKLHSYLKSSSSLIIWPWKWSLLLMWNNLAIYANESHNGNNKHFMKYWEDLSFMNNLQTKTVTDNVFFFLKFKLKWLQIYNAKLLWIMYIYHVSANLSHNPIILFHFRPPGSSYIHYAESSMKNGFGLKYLHRFFNIPFLQLQVRRNSQSQRWTLALGSMFV